MTRNEIENYAVAERLKNGRQVAIRAIRPGDAGLVAEGLRRVSSESLYQRTFSARTIFSDKDIARLVNIDFERIVALVAVMREAGQELIAGEGRYVRTGGAAGTSAEVAFLVDDEHKGIGIGSLIFRHLAVIARSAGVERFEAELLCWNERMMRLFERTNFPVRKITTGCTVHVTIDLG